MQNLHMVLDYLRISNIPFAYDSADTDDVRLEKFTIFLVAASCCIAGCMWSLMYRMVYGAGIIALLPALFVLFVGSSLVISHITGNHYYAVYTQIFCIIYITSLIQWSIGGIFDSGFVMAWAICGPITALIFFSAKHSIVWLGLYLVNLLITALFDDFFTRNGVAIDEPIRNLFFVMNLTVSSVVVFAFANYFVTAAKSERQKSNHLLHSILPSKIARTLKQNTGVIADQHNDVSVLFADLVNFTDYSSLVTPSRLVTS